MPVTFTKEQQETIDARNASILVSAAAGSGKTAVLVERIIQMVKDPVHPVDIDPRRKPGHMGRSRCRRK